MADDVKGGNDKKRVIEQAGGALLVALALETLLKTNCGNQEQGSGKQIPWAGKQVRRMCNGRGGGGKKSGARQIGSPSNRQQHGGGFLAWVACNREITTHGDRGEQKDGEQRAAHQP